MSKAQTKAPAVNKRELPERYKGAKGAADLIKEGIELKQQLDKKIEGSPAWRLEIIKDELNSIQQSNELEGLRTGRFVFIGKLFDGRVSTNLEVVKVTLVERGVDIKVVKAAFAAGTKEGSPFWKREFSEIKE